MRFFMLKSELGFKPASDDPPGCVLACQMVLERRLLQGTKANFAEVLYPCITLFACR